MQLLNRQIAVVNFEPLREHFMAVYTGTQASLPGLNAMPSLRSYMQRNSADKNPEKVLYTSREKLNAPVDGKPSIGHMTCCYSLCRTLMSIIITYCF